MTTKPKVITLCGSSRFIELFAVVSWLLERDEGAITIGLHLLPEWYPNVPASHLAEHEGVAPAMDKLHLRKIDLSDEIFVIDWGNYIGPSTYIEIAYALSIKEIPVRFLSRDYVGELLDSMIGKYGGLRSFFDDYNDLREPQELKIGRSKHNNLVTSGLSNVIDNRNNNHWGHIDKEAENHVLANLKKVLNQ